MHYGAACASDRDEAAMKHSSLGSSPQKVDTVARAMDILKDRPMPKPKPEAGKNIFRKSDRPAPKPEEK